MWGKLGVQLAKVAVTVLATELARQLAREIVARHTKGARR